MASQSGMSIRKIEYGIRYHARITEDDPHHASVMYTMSGPEGPWFDMATGDIGYCNEILDALIFTAYAKQDQSDTED